MKRFILIFTIVYGIPGVVSAQETVIAQGLEIITDFKQALQKALLSGLDHGPVEAINVCKIEAPDIALTLASDNVRMGRTSHRLRNPLNVGPDWANTILDHYSNNPSDRLPKTVNLVNNRSGYIEPIIIQPLCLTCHGENLAPEVAERINETYPSDRAIGYKLGDLRGVFWAEFTNK